VFILSIRDLKKNLTFICEEKMKIQILGTGCPKCNQLAELTEKVAKEIGLDFQLEKITDLEKIMEFGVMMTPALAIDNEVKIIGKIPSADELKKILK